MRKPVRMLVTVAVVIAGGVLFLYLTAPAGQNAKLSKAQLGAKSLAFACEAYSLQPDSKGRFPNSLTDLVDPPLKGAPLLKNGKQDLIDPWGKPYTYALRTLPDGEQAPFIFTTTPDGVAVSQYGVGTQAQPPQP
ncbi:MAG TPA: hypothetical protein VMZ71_09040 [Gemmataceae bacterium]|nr:hypothetical protein [Gemmataceae bacterium]